MELFSGVVALSLGLVVLSKSLSLVLHVHVYIALLRAMLKTLPSSPLLSLCWSTSITGSTVPTSHVSAGSIKSTESWTESELHVHV